MILLVSYDLKRRKEEYKDLYELFKSADGWWHYLESTWLIDTTQSPKEWSDRIKALLGDGDHFIVIEITGQKRQGWLPKKAWQWIRDSEED